MNHFHPGSLEPKCDIIITYYQWYDCSNVDIASYCFFLLLGTQQHSSKKLYLYIYLTVDFAFFSIILITIINFIVICSIKIKKKTNIHLKVSDMVMRL